MAGTVPLPKATDRIFSRTNLRKGTRTNWSRRMDMPLLRESIEADVRALVKTRPEYVGDNATHLAYVINDSVSACTALHDYSVYVHNDSSSIRSESQQITLSSIRDAKVIRLSDATRPDSKDELLVQLAAVAIFGTLFHDGGLLLASESLAITTSGVAVYAVGKGVPISFD